MSRLTWSVPEAAEMLGISRRHCARLVAAGQIPSVRFGGRVVIPKRPLAVFLDQAATASLRRPSTGSTDAGDTPAVTGDATAGTQSPHTPRPPARGVMGTAGASRHSQHPVEAPANQHPREQP